MPDEAKKHPYEGLTGPLVQALHVLTLHIAQLHARVSELEARAGLPASDADEERARAIEAASQPVARKIGNEIRAAVEAWIAKRWPESK